MNHAPCPACRKIVRVVERPDQKHKRIADHGPVLGILCPGTGTEVKNLEKTTRQVNGNSR